MYDVSFKAIKPNIMGTIDLSTPVRKMLEHKITLENPLDTPVTFNVTCPSEIQIPSQFVVQKGSKVSNLVQILWQCSCLFKTEIAST